MEYASQLGGSIAAQSDVAKEPRPADLSSLRAHLERQVERAREISYRVNDLGDLVFGSRPMGVEAGAKAPEIGSAPLADVVEDLSRYLSRIESGLNRL